MRNIPHLRKTIGLYVGQVLTPEAAVAIESSAHHIDDTSIDPARFHPLEHQGYTFQVERFRDIMGELHLMHIEHWKETEGYRHGLQLQPDYLAMLDDERAGKLLQFTVRDGGEVLVGNLRMYIGQSRHTKTLTAREDTLFVVPSARTGLVGLTLMRYAERCLLKLGVRHIEADSKLVNKADVLMRRMGYEAVATKFAKTFGEDHVL